MNNLMNRKKITFLKYFWIFLVCSIIGTLYEEFMHIFWYFVKHGDFNWSRRSGVFFGPINPVYGFGAVIMLLVIGIKKEKNWKVFIKSFFLGGAIEFIFSFLQELISGTTSWDYSNKFLNIGGRTTIPYMFFWGLAGLLLIKWLYPFIERCLEKLPYHIYKVLSIILIILVSIDLLITWSALLRKELRDKGIAPYTFVGELYDEYFDDEYIKNKYPNMLDP